MLLVLSLLLVGPAVATVGGGDVVFQVKDAEKAVFSHEAHVVRGKLGCKECHPRLYLDVAKSKRATMKQMEKGKSCGACHEGKRAFGLDACTKCHK
jgi:c(7)-type cytochrome triheme protein